MFNPNDIELSRHVTALKAHMRDLEMLIRERKEKDLLLTLMLAEKSAGWALERVNRMAGK